MTTITGKQAIGKISVTKKIKGVVTTHEEEEIVAEEQKEQPVCNVGFSGGFTRNLGDFNSMKVQVSLHVPCNADEIDDVYAFAKEWVDKKLDEAAEEADKDE